MDTLNGASNDRYAVARHIWKHLGLPPSAISSLKLSGSTHSLPSSFCLYLLAQGTIGAAGLCAALLYSIRSSTGTVPEVQVPLWHASREFKSERIYTLSGKSMPSPWTIGGLYRTSDGAVRIHDAFTHHRIAALSLLGLPTTASRADVEAKTKLWCAIDLETSALASGAVIYALRTPTQFSQLPACKALRPLEPIRIRKISSRPPSLPDNPLSSKLDKALRGLRVLELSRVIAAPVAGRTLAAHGADVLWITSPNLPSLPDVDVDLSRGKRTAQLDLSKDEDRAKLLDLARTADVFIQSYRPESLAARGLSPDEVCSLNESGMVYANLSAWGPDGPWASRRGFDSLVQTAMGFNSSEAEAFGDSSVLGRPFPAQALDHGAGYLLATGIMAALYRRAIEGGSYVVDVSLAGTGAFLKTLGREENGFSDFPNADIKREGTEPVMEERDTAFGPLKAVKHAAKIDGLDVGYERMSRKLGSDPPEWLAV